MAINKKLIHFKNLLTFELEVANGNILDNSIVFIQDSKEISTHGTVYKTVNWSILERNLITFTISGFEYQAEEGMTWEEFCNSEYNVDNFKAFPDYTEGIALPNDKFNASHYSFAWTSHTAGDFYSKVNMHEVILPKEYFIYLEK